mmetsp:Transcript_6515/g.16705  ORF Transcript_6515/g.16705 Transcript_6515/m.16705 type:complete len:238 (-) Transcript_6515:99-812(-)
MFATESTATSPSLSRSTRWSTRSRSWRESWPEAAAKRLSVCTPGGTSHRLATSGSLHIFTMSATNAWSSGTGTAAESSPSSLESQSDSSSETSSTSTLGSRPSTSSSESDDCTRLSKGVDGSGVKSRGTDGGVPNSPAPFGVDGTAGTSCAISATDLKISTRSLNFGAASQMVRTQGRARRTIPTSTATSRDPRSIMIPSLAAELRVSDKVSLALPSFPAMPARSKRRCTASRAFFE